MPFSIQEGNSTFQILTGSDKSDQPRSVNLRIDSPSKHGSLKLVSSQKVEYRPVNHYFNSPNIAWNGTALTIDPEWFFYSFYTGDGAESVSMRQVIQVQNVNDRTDIRFNYPSSTSKYIVYAMDSSSSVNAERSTLVLDTITIHDYDLGVDPVRVLIYATNGRISLNSDALQLYSDYILFNGATWCNGDTWTCTGDGTDDRRMIFISTPDILHSLLDGMTYACYKPNIVDNITITIYDGEVGSLAYCCI
jgi:hypothetical protein